jgi:hypothetical protein
LDKLIFDQSVVVKILLTGVVEKEESNFVFWAKIEYVS